MKGIEGFTNKPAKHFKCIGKKESPKLWQIQIDTVSNAVSLANIADLYSKTLTYKINSLKVRPLLHIFNSSVVERLGRPEIVSKPVSIPIPKAPQLLNLAIFILHFVQNQFYKV